MIESNPTSFQVQRTALKRYAQFFILLFTFVNNPLTSYTQDSTATKPTVLFFEIHDEQVGMIGPQAERITTKAIDQAEAMDVDYILLDLDTYGGAVNAADAIKTRILSTSIPVFVYIRNNAASAGALISIACDSIYMNPSATMGAASVVDQEGNLAPEKYQSFMRGEMRVTAQEKGRDPAIAEAMVDERVVVEGLVNDEQILTFTVDEAIAYNYCEGKANSPEEALALAGIDDFNRAEYKPDGVEKVIQFFVNPAVAGLLMLLIVGGLYFELQTPGVGFPLAASVIAAILYFIPHYLEGLALHWEIALVIVGILLLAVELFVIPGFGIAGILGIVALFTGLTLSLVANIDFDFTYVPDARLTASILLVAGSFSLVFLLFLFLGGQIASASMFRRVSLRSEQLKEDGYVISEANRLQGLIGKSGVAYTNLRPSGKVEIDGDIYEAQSESEFILPNTPVVVLAVRGAYLIVDDKQLQNT